jgi:hypothetical protein
MLICKGTHVPIGPGSLVRQNANAFAEAGKLFQRVLKRMDGIMTLIKPSFAYLHFQSQSLL